MPYFYNANEVFEIAIEIERNGAKFYNEAARVVQDEGARAELAELGAMEVHHEATFVAMRSELPSQDTEHWYDPEAEATKYLQAFAKGQVFDLTRERPADLLGPEADLKRILQYALERERDAVLFYVGIKELMPASFGKDKIDRIIREEMSHVALISQRIAELSWD